VSLPRYATEFVGRAKALSEIDALLMQSRLVTIVGAGGIGKTRMAVEVAGAKRGESAFVDLEPIRDPQLVASTVAHEVGVELRGSDDPETALVKLLAQQPVLLVLDNCEHLLKRVSALCERIIASCPEVRMLATSREALGVDAESIYRLQTLDEDEGVQLFIERARSATLEESKENTAVIGEICRKLDGIPLAIELAAGRLDDRTPKALLARLTERFRLLGQDSSTGAKAHHRTLRAMIDWSYDLLHEKQRVEFARFGVFNGEYSTAAARAIVGKDVDLEPYVRKSLIIASLDHEERFRMLESMREYAWLRLEARESEDLHRAHAQLFADLAEEASRAFGTVSEEVWLSRYELDTDNFRAALAWLQRRDMGLAATMLGNLKEFWFHSNLSSEGLSRSQVMVATLRLDDDRALGPLLAVASLAWRAGENRTSHDAAERALSIAQRTEDKLSIAQARYCLGWALFKLGDMERARAELKRSVEELRALDQPLRALLAEIDYAIALKRSDPAAGRTLLGQTLPAAQASGWPRAAIRAETGLAEYAFLDGDAAAAIDLGGQALATARKGNSAYAVMVAVVNMTAYLSIAGRIEDARATGAEAMTLGRANGFRIAVEWTLQSLAIGIAERGDAKTAAMILGHVDAFVDEVGAEREPTEERVRRRLYEIVSNAIDESALEAIMRQGRALSMDDACMLAV
jgi:predicted ATPase